MEKNPFAYPYDTFIFIVRWFLKSFDFYSDKETNYD